MGEALARRFGYVSSLFEEISLRSGVRHRRHVLRRRAPRLSTTTCPPRSASSRSRSRRSRSCAASTGSCRTPSCGYSLGTYAAFVAAGCLSTRGRARRPARGRAAPGRGARERRRWTGTMGFVIGLGAAGRRGGARGRLPGPLAPRDRDGERGGAVRPDGGAGARRERPSTLLRPRGAEGGDAPDRIPDALEKPRRRYVTVCKSFLEGGVRVSPPRSALYAPMLGRRVENGADAAHVLSKQISLPSLFAPTLLAMRSSRHSPLRRGRPRRRPDAARPLDAPRRDRRAAARSRRPEDVAVFAATVAPGRARIGCAARGEPVTDAAAHARRARDAARPAASAAPSASASPPTGTTPSSRTARTPPAPRRPSRRSAPRAAARKPRSAT